MARTEPVEQALARLRGQQLPTLFPAPALFPSPNLYPGQDPSEAASRALNVRVRDANDELIRELAGREALAQHRSACNDARVPPRDSPRLLHRRSERGYTEEPAKALFAEPEAISREDQDWLTERAHRSERAAQVAEWAQRRGNIARELDWLYSQRFRRDVSAQLHQLQKQLERIDAKIAGT